jgi:hypothetical protein
MVDADKILPHCRVYVKCLPPRTRAVISAWFLCFAYELFLRSSLIFRRYLKIGFCPSVQRPSAMGIGHARLRVRRRSYHNWILESLLSVLGLTQSQSRKLVQFSPASET